MADEFNEDDILGRILVQRPEQEPAPARTFKPWHRPRKQWIRRYQWHDASAAILRETHFPADARIFRYLSMPGEDLLDIRMLREACEEQGVELRFTGLNSVKPGTPDDIRLNIAESEVRGLARIHPGSQILRERFEAIADPNSLAYGAIRNSGPFNAINIDLCDHIALRPQGGGRHTIIDSLAEIIRGQLTYASHPWLLFVTTRVAPDRVEARNLSAFIQAISDNIDRSPDFERGTANLLREEGDALRAALAEPMALTPDRFVSLFCLGFGKWLLAYICQATPARRLSMLRSCVYAVQGGHPDMLSLAFRCDPVSMPPIDSYQLVRPQAPAHTNEEVQLAIALVEETRQIFNLDEMLENEPQLLEAVTVESEQLLRSAHYVVDAVDGEGGYRAWLEGRAA
jgi:hypothetical protein